MPTLEDNKRFWSDEYDWETLGNEWSADWGGPDMQWYGTLLPRIHAFVPTGTILEIACGCGRWTRYLQGLCTRLIAVDLSERCIRICRQRFRDLSHVEFHLNDGTSLAAVSAPLDFVFSFDSLVHADIDVIEAYLSQLAGLLRRDGVVFLHHSNLGEYARLPGFETLFSRLGFLERRLHGRDFSVDAAKVAAVAQEHGLQCISQEIVGAGGLMIDCLSVLVRRDSPRARENRIFRNTGFTREKRNLRRLARLYAFRQDDEKQH